MGFCIIMGECQNLKRLCAKKEDVKADILSEWIRGAAVAEWISSWIAEQEVRGSIPGLAT